MSQLQSHTILILNPLDARYGSTYRIRALCDLAKNKGWNISYIENPGSAVKKCTALISASLFKNYDLLFTQKFNPITLAAILIAQIRRKPVVVDWDDIDVGLQGSFIKKWVSVLCENIGPSLTTMITTHSQEIAHRASEKKPVAIVSQGYDEKLFSPSYSKAACKKKWGFLNNEIVIGHLCTFTHGGTLNLSIILDSWAMLSHEPCKFFLIGGGPLEREIQKELTKRNLQNKTKISGLLPHEEIPQALSCLDVGVVFMTDTKANRSRVSFKVIEYLALDIPVVGQVVGETNRLFGHWIEKARQENLTQKTIEVAKNKKSSNTSKLMHPFEWNQTASALNHVFETCILRKATKCL